MAHMCNLYPVDLIRVETGLAVRPVMKVVIDKMIGVLFIHYGYTHLTSPFQHS